MVGGEVEEMKLCWLGVALLAMLMSTARADAAGIPTWTEDFLSPKDGISYPTKMIGADPTFNGARTKHIPVNIVPLLIELADGTIFDPNAADPCANNRDVVSLLLESPLFQPYDFTINGVDLGSGQYVDEFQRANFYSYTQRTGDKYHTILDPTVLPTVTLNIPAAASEVWSFGGCTSVAALDWATFNPMLTKILTVQGSTGVTSNALTIFLVHNVVQVQGGLTKDNCCIIASHNNQFDDQQPFNWIVSDYDTTSAGAPIDAPDIAGLSHEIAEWMNDPFLNNRVPDSALWGPNGLLEVGDYTEGIGFVSSGIAMPNGVTYHPQQLAYAWFFFGTVPSLGAGQGYSASGNPTPALTAPAP